MSIRMLCMTSVIALAAAPAVAEMNYQPHRIVSGRPEHDRRRRYRDCPEFCALALR